VVSRLEIALGGDIMCLRSAAILGLFYAVGLLFVVWLCVRNGL